MSAWIKQAIPLVFLEITMNAIRVGNNEHAAVRRIDRRVQRWLDAEMNCRDNFGGCLFSIQDFEKVRRAIKLAMEG